MDRRPSPASGGNEGGSPYVDTDRLFARGEPISLAKAALSNIGPWETRELVIHIMAAKGLNTRDKALAKTIAFRMIHALLQQRRRANLADVGRRARSNAPQTGSGPRPMICPGPR